MLVEAVADARLLAPGHHWRLDLPAAPVEVVGDPDRLRQVVTNLLTNARLHTPAGTTVEVRADAGGLTVHDDGPGFPEQLRGREFDRFTRGEESRTRRDTRSTSTGLGLSVVAAVVAAHGGRVTVTSRPGATTVRVDLPGAPTDP